MFTEQLQLTSSKCGVTLAYYLVPYLLDTHDYRRRFSGPFAASLSNWWLSRSAQSGNHSEIIHELHEKYGACFVLDVDGLMPITSGTSGKFVRIGPNHISIADPSALEVAYEQSNGLLKSEFYEAFQTDPLGNVFNVRDKAVHTMKRKRIANVFSAQNVQAFESGVRSHIEKFCVQLDTRCEQALKEFSYIAFDIMSDLALGIPFGLIEGQKDSIHAALSLVSEKNVENLPVIHMIAQGATGAMALGSHSPFLEKIHLFGASWHTPDFIARRDFVEMTRAAVNTRVSRMENGIVDDENRGVDFLDKLFEVTNADGSPLSRDEIDAEALVTIGAGSDTTSNSLGALCYYVASNPQVKKKLHQELDSVQVSVDKNESESAYDLAKFERVKNLPYLNACVKEALRLYSTGGGGLPRVLPPPPERH
ncbi:unnamed protein product [Rhizoctonia solani]|uniref:Uncharacterized protein n=1 Tax=Rhizoctonia solani TaxID=456999 RepID=A0A8H2WF71_9AGAM|nr:unnamed protein product [Rhizoctonia solani]